MYDALLYIFIEHIVEEIQLDKLINNHDGICIQGSWKKWKLFVQIQLDFW